MHHIVLVGIRQRVAHAHDISKLYGQRKHRVLFDDPIQALPFEILHGNEWSIFLVAELVNRHDVGVLQSAGRTRFLVKTIEEIRLRARASRDGL